MLLLAIDTCARPPISEIGDRDGNPEPGLSRLRGNQPKDLGTIALARLHGDELEILGQAELPGKTFSAQLVPTIRDLLTHNNVALAQIATIVVTNGPGSFTGIRIGLSTAKGLAEVHSVPILAVSRLAVLAHKAQTKAAALETLKALGARLISDDIQIGAGGHLYFFVHPSSANGVLLEICQDAIADV